MKTFISVDLDYWFCDPVDNFASENCITYLDFLKKRLGDLPIFVHHHEMLSLVNKSKCEKLINLDFHSDLGGLDDKKRMPELNCGTWVDRVRWRRNGHFHWVYPQTRCYQAGDGLCHGDYQNPFTHPGNTHWKKVTRKKANPPIFPLKDSSEYQAAICVSPDYCYGINYETIFGIMKFLSATKQQINSVRRIMRHYP